MGTSSGILDCGQNPDGKPKIKDVHYWVTRLDLNIDPEIFCITSKRDRKKGPRLGEIVRLWAPSKIMKQSKDMEINKWLKDAAGIK